MSTIDIEAQLCQKCGTCVQICPANIFVQDDRSLIPQTLDLVECLDCGHCLAGCPSQAISHPSFSKASIHPIDFERLPSRQQLMELLRARRSVREFRKKSVDPHLLEQTIEGARFAPSACNSQSTEFTVVKDKMVLYQITQMTVDYLRELAKKLKNPWIRQFYRWIAGKEIQAALDGLSSFETIIDAFDRGTDLVLHNAPVLLVFHADCQSPFANVNANLALQNACLVGETVGLGNFYAGFVVAACTRDRRIAKLLGLPANHKIYGALAIGHPKFRYKNWIEKKPAQIHWI